MSIKHKDGVAPYSFLETNGLVHSLKYPIGYMCTEDNGHMCVKLVTHITGGVIATSRIDG